MTPGNEALAVTEKLAAVYIDQRATISAR